MSEAPKISVAPMIDWTDRHCRYFHRVISKHAQLYTEMIVDKAIIHGERARLLDADADKENIVLQIGGSEPGELAEAVKIAFDFGYDHINLNCGCPSDRVQSGTFGAVLMLDPAKTARALIAMREAASANISVKCRLGVDDQEVQNTLPDFLSHIKEAGVKDVIIHARKAWLKGLSPKENREIPPLDYDLAFEMLQKFPMLNISLNGGITHLDEADGQLKRGFKTVMIGRAAYQRPYDILANIDAQFHDGDAPIKREEIVGKMTEYAKEHLKNGGRLHQITRHMLGLFHAQEGGRRWRQMLSQNATKPDAKTELLFEAMPR